MQILYLINRHLGHFMEKRTECSTEDNIISIFHYQHEETNNIIHIQIMHLKTLHLSFREELMKN